jgi:citrate synthase
MSTAATTDPDFRPGLEGVIAFESEIAEPDKEGGALRYRGVDLKDLVGRVSFGQVWGLLVDNEFDPGLPPAEPFPLPVHSGDIRVDVQSALAQLAPVWGFKPLLDIDDAEVRDNLARASVMAISFIGQSAHGQSSPMVPQSEVDKGRTIAERFMIRWRGEPDPKHVEAIDAYFISAAEHGMNASTFTARVIASTGADAAACLSGAIGALSGPLHGGAPSRAQHMIEGVEQMGDARRYVKEVLDRKERLMGFGHRVYRAYDPRAAVLRDTCQRLGAPRYEVALELEKAAIAELAERYPERRMETNVDYWAAVLLDFADVPGTMMTPLFAAARTAGWSAHVLEQKRTGRLIRPSARYVGPGPRPLEDVAGFDPERCSTRRGRPGLAGSDKGFHVLELTSGIRASWVKMDAGHGSPTTSARSHRVPLPHRSGRPQPRLNPTPTLENHRERRPDHHPR